MSSQIDISVVMSVYNGARYLRKSAESILSQEGVDFEFIIVNDGSTDESGDILAEYAARDKRIRIIEQENTGLTRALIRGCNEAHGKFIARQDADDISMPGRLTKLVSLLESDQRIVFVSSWTQYIGPKDELVYEVTRPADPEKATIQLMYERMGPPAHGSVMFRTDTYKLVGGYREEFYYGQDSDLWLRLSQIGKVAYIPEYLYKYRYSTDAISLANRDLQKRFGEIGQLCHVARMRSESDEPFLLLAAKLREQIIGGHVLRVRSNSLTADGHYFLGSGLYSRSDSRATAYFWKAVKANPLHWRAWLKMISSVANKKKGSQGN